MSLTTQIAKCIDSAHLRLIYGTSYELALRKGKEHPYVVLAGSIFQKDYFATHEEEEQIWEL